MTRLDFGKRTMRHCGLANLVNDRISSVSGGVGARF
jgi:hypothetical protein